MRLRLLVTSSPSAGAVHLSLMPGDYGRVITVTLNGERHKGYVWVHDLAVATKVDTP